MKQTRFTKPFYVLLLFVLMVSVAGTSSAAADGPANCSDISQPKCSIQLSTGITMRYLEVGPTDGLAVFLLHGYAGASSSWSLVLPTLHRLSPDLHIIAPDLRGHADSSLPSEAKCPAAPQSCFEPIDFAHDIIAFMDARHIHKAVMVGHSMGTLVAQELGLSYPERVSRLVLVSTATHGNEPAVHFVLDYVIEGVWQSAFTAQGYAWPTDVYTLSPAVAVPDYQAETATPLGTQIGALQAIAAADNTERLKHLQAPTLVLWGVQDNVFSRAIEQTLIDSLTAAAVGQGSFWWKEYGVLPTPETGEQTDLGHGLPSEAPDAVALDIASFIERGQPTRILFRTNYPEDIHQIIAEPGHAILIHQP
jgi:pimeloyl-ACP methyl ester carboxylesterase